MQLQGKRPDWTRQLKSDASFVQKQLTCCQLPMQHQQNTEDTGNTIKVISKEDRIPHLPLNNQSSADAYESLENFQTR